MLNALKGLKIKTKLFSALAIVTLGYAIFDFINYRTFNFLKVNGPLYNDIALDNSIIADVLPPPKYIIESYLVLNRLLLEDDPAEVERLFRESSRLENEYHQRQQFWVENFPAQEGELRDELLRLSHKPALEFFKLKNEQFIPLILQGDKGRAKWLLNSQLKPLYDRHRQHIDKTVLAARLDIARDEQASARMVFRRTFMIALAGVPFIVIGFCLLLYLVEQIISPVLKLIRSAENISGGNLTDKVPSVNTNDEVGSLAKALEEMRLALKDNIEKLLKSRNELETRSALYESVNKELQEANAMNQLLLQNIPFAMDVIDEEGNILALNQKSEAIFGREIIGEKCWTVHKDDKLQCPDCPLRRDITLGKAEVIEVSGIGGGRIFEVTHNGMMYQGRKAILQIFHDVTERKRQEQELREAHEQLLAAQGRLVQSAKMASIGQLAGGVAHEINNPLTGVLNNVQLIKMLARQKDSLSLDEFINILDTIEESALRCASITRSLLDFSYSGKVNFRALSLNEPAEKALSLVSNELKLQNIAIEKQLQSGLPYIFGDSQLLQQVVFDIVANARWAILKKSPDGGGSIALKSWHNVDEKKVYLSIADTGIGISPENLGKVFDPFFTTKPIGDGTGLGLSVVYSIIKEHQGSITVDSQPGKGASFIVGLPVLENDENQRPVSA